MALHYEVPEVLGQQRWFVAFSGILSLKFPSRSSGPCVYFVHLIGNPCFIYDYFFLISRLKTEELGMFTGSMNLSDYSLAQKFFLGALLYAARNWAESGSRNLSLTVPSFQSCGISMSYRFSWNCVIYLFPCFPYSVHLRCYFSVMPCH